MQCGEKVTFFISGVVSKCVLKSDRDPLFFSDPQSLSPSTKKKSTQWQPRSAHEDRLSNCWIRVTESFPCLKYSGNLFHCIKYSGNLFHCIKYSENVTVKKGTIVRTVF